MTLRVGGGVTGDQSFRHGYFLIYIQYLTTALERILFSSVVMVDLMAFRQGVPGSNFVQILYFSHAFVSLLRTLFVKSVSSNYALTCRKFMDSKRFWPMSASLTGVDIFRKFIKPFLKEHGFYGEKYSPCPFSSR